jgi:hypothetical protein
VIGTDYIGGCKSNYNMITTTMAPKTNGYQGYLLSYLKHGLFDVWNEYQYIPL